MDLLPKIKEVLDSEPSEVQLDKFLNDVRDSLSTSNKQLISFSLLAVVALVTYHLVVYEGATPSAFQGVPLAGSSLVQRVFLVVPAGLLCAAAAVGYLRRCQREVYDYLIISRYRVLAKTGLHELRLPSDYILGLFYLKTEGGIVGRAISSVVMVLEGLVFTVGPVVYIAHASGESLARYGLHDMVAFVGAVVAMVLAAASLIIVVLASRIRP